MLGYIRVLASVPFSSYWYWKHWHMRSEQVSHGSSCIANTLEKCVSKLKAWKEGMENKGLRVNMKKTKLMVTGPGLDVLRDSGAFPCAVCRNGVGASNTIKCLQCTHWVHKRCSSIQGRIVANQN